VSSAVLRAVEHIEAAREREAALVDSLIRKNMELGQLNKVFHDLASRDGLTASTITASSRMPCSRSLSARKRMAIRCPSSFSMWTTSKTTTIHTVT